MRACTHLALLAGLWLPLRSVTDCSRAFDGRFEPTVDEMIDGMFVGGIEGTFDGTFDGTLDRMFHRKYGGKFDGTFDGKTNLLQSVLKKDEPAAERSPSGCRGLQVGPSATPSGLRV